MNYSGRLELKLEILEPRVYGESGQALVEYAMVLALTTLLAMSGLMLLSGSMGQIVDVLEFINGVLRSALGG